MATKLSKAKEISPKTRKTVLERQKGRSISGVYLMPYSTEFHHFIYRSGSGVGYEWNVVALTSEEHRAVHDHQPIKIFGRERYSADEFEILMRNHLKENYTNWSEDLCRYRKGWNEEDYEVKRNNQRRPNPKYFQPE